MDDEDGVINVDAVLITKNGFLTPVPSNVNIPAVQVADEV